MKRRNAVKHPRGRGSEHAGEARAHLSRPHDSCLFSGPSNGPTGTLCASTHDADDADGTDGIFGTRAHRDDSCPDPALTSERHLVSSLERTVLAEWVRQAYRASLRTDSAVAKVLTGRNPPARSS